MQVITNEKLIASRVRLGRIAGLVGMAVLLAGLFLTFRQEQSYILLWYPAVVVGLIATMVAAYNAEKFIREPRADLAIARAMKGFDNRYQLFNWVLPAEHVILGPAGVLVLLAKRQSGHVVCENDRWQHKQNLFARFQGFARERLGNPNRDLAAEVERIRQIVAEVESETAVPVQGVVLFLNASVDLAVNGCSVDVVPLKKLKDYLKAWSRGPKVPDHVRREVAQALEAVRK